jgi:glutathione peroxidase
MAEISSETSSQVYDIPVRTLGGKDTSLREYQGEVLLVVNVASACGLTPQYKGLESLYAENKARGFSVLGFPCNQFGAQEPGTNAEIAEFCSLHYGVTFPMFDKIDVNGPDRHPLYQKLIAAQPQSEPVAPASSEDIAWNFEKFLIDRKGDVIARFSPKVTPEDPELRSKLAAALGE